MKIVCCDCKRVMNKGTGETGEKISHTYCATCYGKAIADINAYFGVLENERDAGVGSVPGATLVSGKERMIA